MNKFDPRHGTPAPKWRHMQYIADSMLGGVKAALGDYLAVSEDFFISGQITDAPSGASTIYTATAGYVCYKGEVMPIEAHSVTKTASQVVFIQVQDDSADITPVVNLDGNTEHVMRYRHARLRTASVYPTEYMPLTALRKEAIDRLRFKGRLFVPGGIMPFFGAMDDFSGTGLGLTDTAMEGWAICNGLNGTPDLRGVALVGATNVPSSGAPAPTHPGVANNTDAGDEVGADNVTLVPDQLPAHKHEIDFAGTSAWIGSGAVANITSVGGTGDSVVPFPDETEDNTTTGDAVDVRQASFALVWIMSIV